LYWPVRLLAVSMPLPGKVPRRVCEKAPLLAYCVRAEPPDWLLPMNMRNRCRDAEPIARVPNTPWACRPRMVGIPVSDWFNWLSML
jgi:hypothetical protein